MYWGPPSLWQVDDLKSCSERLIKPEGQRHVWPTKDTAQVICDQPQMIQCVTSLAANWKQQATHYNTVAVWSKTSRHWFTHGWDFFKTWINLSSTVTAKMSDPVVDHPGSHPPWKRVFKIHTHLYVPPAWSCEKLPSISAGRSRGEKGSPRAEAFKECPSPRQTGRRRKRKCLHWKSRFAARERWPRRRQRSNEDAPRGRAPQALQCLRASQPSWIMWHMARINSGFATLIVINVRTTGICFFPS